MTEQETKSLCASTLRVRFLADSRHGDWKKGQLASVVKELVVPPQNQFKILVVELEDGTQVWATDKDFEPFNQLSLF